jgi:hypothetical protein
MPRPQYVTTRSDWPTCCSTGKLSEFVFERRAKHGRSWRLIARDLYEQTGIDLTYETLRRWYPDDDESPDVQEKCTA